MLKPPASTPATPEERSDDTARTLERMAEMALSQADLIESRLAELKVDPGVTTARTIAQLERTLASLRRGARLSLAMRDKIRAREAKQAGQAASLAARRSHIREALIRRALKERAAATLH